MAARAGSASPPVPRSRASARLWQLRGSPLCAAPGEECASPVRVRVAAFRVHQHQPEVVAGRGDRTLAGALVEVASAGGIRFSTAAALEHHAQVEAGEELAAVAAAAEELARAGVVLRDAAAFVVAGAERAAASRLAVIARALVEDRGACLVRRPAASGLERAAGVQARLPVARVARGDRIVLACCRRRGRRSRPTTSPRTHDERDEPCPSEPHAPDASARSIPVEGDLACPDAPGPRCSSSPMLGIDSSERLALKRRSGAISPSTGR